MKNTKAPVALVAAGLDIVPTMNASALSLALAYSAGYFATLCFTLQYIPQAILNYKRKSITGFSTTGILIKVCHYYRLYM